MKFLSARFFSIGLLSLLFSAQPLSAAANEKLIEELLTSRTAESFAAAYVKAQQAHVPTQVLLEARFLYRVDKQDNKALAALSTELIAATPTFDPSLSSIFSLKEDWQAITHYTLALGALEKNDPTLFKKHITEAFWYSPRQASAFAPHIDQFRLDQAMQLLTLPTDLTLPNLHNDQQTALFNKESKATLVYFWSPWSREFGEAIEEFKALATESKKHNIQFVAVLAERSSEVKIDAKSLIEEEKLQNLASWCIDTENLTLSNKLRIQSAPTAILLSNEGKVLSNSHPASAKLWNALKKVSPEIKRPASTAPAE